LALIINYFKDIANFKNYINWSTFIISQVLALTYIISDHLAFFEIAVDKCTSRRHCLFAVLEFRLLRPDYKDLRSTRYAMYDALITHVPWTSHGEEATTVAHLFLT